MAKRQKSTIQQTSPMTRRQRARWEEENIQQRRVILGVGGLLLVVVLLVIGGLVWDKFIVPSRTVAQVGDTEIENAEYQHYRRISQAVSAYSNYATALQFAQFQPESGATFQQQAVQSFQDFKERNPGIDYTIVNRLIDDHLIRKGAEQEGITVTDDEVYQVLAERFAPPPAEEMNPVAPVSETAELTGTDTLTDTVEPTAIPEPTATPEPTGTPTAQDARDQVEIALINNYGELRDFVAAPPIDAAGTELPFTSDDYIEFVVNQQRIELLRERLGEKFVSEDEAPKQVVADAEQIFVRVTAPFTETAEVTEALWLEGEERINDIKQRLDEGADFAELLATESDLDQPGGQAAAGLQPLAYWDSFGITEPISTQEVGVIGEPYRSEQGWHIVRVTERTEQADENELTTLRTTAVDEWLANLRETIAVQIFPEPTATPVPPTIDPALLPPEGAYPPPIDGEVEAPETEVTPTP